MAVINIDDAYILNETGAQVDKVTGLFTKDEDTTSGEKAFAQLNIGTAGSNRNLLDNPFFTVRQRGDGPFTSAGYTVDRWTMTANATVTAESGGLHFVAAQTYRGFSQYLETPANLAGLTVTLSVDITSLNGGFYVRLYNGAGSPFETHQFREGLNSFTFTVPANGLKEVYFTNISATLCDVLIHAVKLELGSVSTLANDAPPELPIARIPCYENHLRLKGQYAPVGYAIALSTTLALLAIPTPVPMRIAPTPSLSGTLYFNAGTPFAITSVKNPTLGVNQVMIQVVGTFDTGKVYLAQFRDATSYLDLSADL